MEKSVFYDCFYRLGGRGDRKSLNYIRASENILNRLDLLIKSNITFERQKTVKIIFSLMKCLK